MIILTKANFSDTLKCDKKLKLVIGVSNGCGVCKRLIENLTKKNVEFGSINLNDNPEYLRNLRRCGKLTSTNIGVPLILIYNNNEFIKINPITTNPDDIIY